ncbi:MAG: hypothetical protein DRR19_28675 [Candidatus Parabeggiatoa sp. nov. 1]|nr:MAG: hypothetical protein DRR19_28675 [Gammaproteobacteria bacterium]
MKNIHQKKLKINTLGPAPYIYIKLTKRWPTPGVLNLRWFCSVFFNKRLFHYKSHSNSIFEIRFFGFHRISLANLNPIFWFSSDFFGNLNPIWLNLNLISKKEIRFFEINRISGFGPKIG